MEKNDALLQSERLVLKIIRLKFELDAALRSLEEFANVLLEVVDRSVIGYPSRFLFTPEYLSRWPGTSLLWCISNWQTEAYNSEISFCWTTNFKVCHRFSRRWTLEGISSSLWLWQATTSRKWGLMWFKNLIFDSIRTHVNSVMTVPMTHSDGVFKVRRFTLRTLKQTFEGGEWVVRGGFRDADQSGVQGVSQPRRLWRLLIRHEAPGDRVRGAALSGQVREETLSRIRTW